MIWELEKAIAAADEANHKILKWKTLLSHPASDKEKVLRAAFKDFGLNFDDFINHFSGLKA